MKAAYFYEQGQPWEPNGVGGVDSRTVYPQNTTNYELRVVQQNDQVVTRTIQILVNPKANAPEIAEFSASPDNQVQAGACVQLHWDVRGQVDSVKISANGAAVWDGAPVNAGQQHCPPPPSVTYTLEARGPGGTSRAERRLNVVEVQPPVVNSLANTNWAVTSVNRQPVAVETGLEMQIEIVRATRQ